MLGFILGLFYIKTLLFTVSMPTLPPQISPGSEVNQEISAFVTETSDLRPKILSLALVSYNCAIKKGIKDDKKLLTIIDYSLPSNVPRLWVLDLKAQTVLFRTLVAHGKYSGSLIATHFSDQIGSEESSIGLYRTKGTYFGHKGYSLILQGLDVGFNERAEARHVVMHGAWYVSKKAVQRHGRLGRSWGCPALDEKIVKPVINTIKNGTLVFAYFPDKNWLKKSIYLHC